MQAMKYIAAIIIAIVALLIIKPFFDQRTPDAYVRANNEAIRMQPTATAAALENIARAQHDAIVVPVQATAEAASILANNEQRIDEDKHQQALRHDGEMAALAVSNTERLNEVQALYTARVEGIKAGSAKTVAEANADAARASAGAWRDTFVYGGLSIGAVVLLVGCALGVVAWLSTRAKIIEHPITGPMLVTSHGVIMLANVPNPAITWNNQQLLTHGENVLPLVAQRQTFALIGKASNANNPEMVRAAERAATSVVQQNWQNNALLDSAVQALPAGRDDLAGHVPTFAELLRTWRPSLAQMLFGFDEYGQPIYGSLDQLLSCLVIGRQNQGKTTLLRLINMQCLMTGVQVIGWDIHDDIAESVPGIEMYTRPADIERSARGVIAELDRRINLKLKHDRVRPLMVLIDEVNLVAERVPLLTDVAKRIVSEGRKYRVFEFITAKGAPSDLFEKSWARDSFSALISFWTSALQARNAGFETDTARRVETLTPGHALLRLQTAPAQVVTFPNLSLEDMQNMVSNTASRAASGAASEPLPETPAMVSGEAEKAAEIDYFDSAEVENKASVVRQLLKDGRSQREVIAEVWGATGGRSYQQAAEELRQIIQGFVS